MGVLPAPRWLLASLFCLLTSSALWPAPTAAQASRDAAASDQRSTWRPPGLTPGIYLGLRGGASTRLDPQGPSGAGGLGANLAAEATFGLTPVLGLRLTHHLTSGAAFETTEPSRQATHAELRLSMRTQRMTPYLLLGGRVAYGDDAPAVGAVAGIGLDWKLHRSITLFQEVTFASPAGIEAPGVGTLGAGLRFNVHRRYRPPAIGGILHPDSLIRGRPATFSADVAGDATLPVAVRWTFENGMIREGNPVDHTFARPGTYRVHVTTTGPGGEEHAAVDVTVVDDLPLVRQAEAARRTALAEERAPQITEVYGRRELRVGEAENFRARLGPSAARPTIFRWNLGDGTEAVGNNVVHRYKAPGRYRVSVEARNTYGTATEEITVTVAEEPIVRPSPREEETRRGGAARADGAPADTDPPRAAPYPASALRSHEGLDWEAGGYTLLVATRLERASAEQTALDMRRRGFRTGIKVDDDGRGSRAYRVVVGQFGTEEAAVAARRELLALDLQGLVIPIEP